MSKEKTISGFLYPVKELETPSQWNLLWHRPSFVPKQDDAYYDSGTWLQKLVYTFRNGREKNNSTPVPIVLEMIVDTRNNGPMSRHNQFVWTDYECQDAKGYEEYCQKKLDLNSGILVAWDLLSNVLPNSRGKIDSWNPLFWVSWCSSRLLAGLELFFRYATTANSSLMDLLVYRPCQWLADKASSWSTGKSIAGRETVNNKILSPGGGWRVAGGGMSVVSFLWLGMGSLALVLPLHLLNLGLSLLGYTLRYTRYFIEATFSLLTFLGVCVYNIPNMLSPTLRFDGYSYVKRELSPEEDFSEGSLIVDNKKQEEAEKIAKEKQNETKSKKQTNLDLADIKPKKYYFVFKRGKDTQTLTVEGIYYIGKNGKTWGRPDNIINELIERILQKRLKDKKPAINIVNNVDIANKELNADEQKVQLSVILKKHEYQEVITSCLDKLFREEIVGDRLYWVTWYNRRYTGVAQASVSFFKSLAILLFITILVLALVTPGGQVLTLPLWLAWLNPVVQPLITYVFSPLLTYFSWFFTQFLTQLIADIFAQIVLVGVVGFIAHCYIALVEFVHRWSTLKLRQSFYCGPTEEVRSPVLTPVLDNDQQKVASIVESNNVPVTQKLDSSQQQLSAAQGASVKRATICFAPALREGTPDFDLEERGPLQVLPAVPVTDSQPSASAVAVSVAANVGDEMVSGTGSGSDSQHLGEQATLLDSSSFEPATLPPPPAAPSSSSSSFLASLTANSTFEDLFSGTRTSTSDRVSVSAPTSPSPPPPGRKDSEPTAANTDMTAFSSPPSPSSL